MSSEAPAAERSISPRTRRTLHKLGYAQELFRAMGGFQNFAISFTIISILAGCLTSYYIAFESGGPIAVTWGWLLIGLFSTIISLAMAEIASSFPTAGGLYYWASKLGSPGWGWATGWFNLIGQIAVTAAIGYGLATFATVLFDDLFSFEKHTNDWFGFNYNQTVYFLYALFLLAACLINVFDVRITAMLNTISAYWHMAGVAFIVLVLIIVPDHHQSASFVFGGQVNATGYGDNDTGFHHAAFWLVFGLGLLMAQYTITGFDASAHMAEETHQASRMAAVGMYMSVVVSVIFGFILLVAVTFAVPSTQGALDNIGAVVPWIWETSMSENWSDALLAICVVAQFFCLTASTTSASRMMFAFSRDGAVPGHQLWRRVSKHRVPVLRRVRDRRPLGAADGAGDLELPRRLRGRHGDRRDRALHRVRAARLPAAAARRQVRARRLEPRPALQVDRHVALLWVAIITVLFSLPLFYDGLPWSPNFSWSLTNYTVLWFAGIGLVLRRLVGAFGPQVVQGPGADGHRGGAREARDQKDGSCCRRTPSSGAPSPDSARGAPNGAPRVPRVIGDVLTLEELTAEVEAGTIDTVVCAFTDMQGRLLGKREQAQFFLAETVEHGLEGCNYLLALDMEMDPQPGYAMASWERGYGDFHLRPDLATLRRVPWLEGTALVLCDVGLGGRLAGRRLAAPGARGAGRAGARGRASSR